MKRIGFLSFGHWRDVPGSHARSARESLLQAIDLAVAAEDAGVDGAYFGVHHFAEQQASPFPLLAAIAARTSRIEIGTAVIDMRYENPLYLAEEAAAVDLISGAACSWGSAVVRPSAGADHRRSCQPVGRRATLEGNPRQGFPGRWVPYPVCDKTARRRL